MAEEKKESACNAKRVYRIGGVSVDFPYKAYASQLAFMGKVVATLERSHGRVSADHGNNNGGRCHALLESPTGTGKSLALLCSTLAWLKHYKASSSSCHPPAPKPPLVDVRSSETYPVSAPRYGADLFSEGLGVAGQEVAMGGGGFVTEVTGTDGCRFVPDDFSTGGGFIPEATAEERSSDGSKQVAKKRKHPTIFYATRTHSQITQVVREYRKTSYRVSMAVLAARKHYCTNKQVCKKKNIDDECKLLLKDRERSCLQFKNFHKVKNHYSLQKGGTHEIHDIEDLVGIGHSVKGCAYFAARSMATDAEIVFCPYGYLLNPVIRNAMEINLQGAIIILDEAHNIEDAAREAGSIDLETSMLEGIRMELEQLTFLGATADFYHPLLDMVQEMLTWIYQKSTSLEKQDFERYSSCWFGEGALQELELAGIRTQSFAMLSECAKKALGAAAEAEADKSHLSGFAAGMLEGLFSVLNFLLKDNCKHVHDYRLVVQKYVKRDHELGVTGWASSLSLWCLNPAVVFEEVASKAQSIILTSGTLSPIGSFATELGVPFEVCMEAHHVIDMKTQVWAASVPKGLGNVPLNASYKHADGYAFQDALGTTVEEVFKVSPDGALVFFPSYKLLEKLCDRWKATGQWKRLYEEKQLFVEPRGKMEDFETMLDDYYGVINGKTKAAIQKGKSRAGGKKISKERLTDSLTRQPKSGAAFLAVCRGKVSEGIDFSDKNARVVILVGIPFPNQKDMQVSMKKQYNTQNKVSRNLLSGDQWYCYQAFRALNQAVGRCIRHRYDYGAIVLLDERYKRASNLEYMSKWLRSSIQQIESLEDSLKGLQSFFAKFKDTLPHSVDANINISKGELKKKSGSGSQTLQHSFATAPAKQSKKIIFINDKENLSKGLLAKTAANAPTKQSDDSGKETMEVHSTRAGCKPSPASRQHRSPLQEIVLQARENLAYGSVITIVETPKAPCFAPSCSHDDANKNSSVKRGGSGGEEQWTPIASTISDSSEVNASILLNTSSKSQDNFVSARSCVTPCNLFEESNEDIFISAGRTPEIMPTINPLIRSLTTDFTSCKKLSLSSNENCYTAINDSLSACKGHTIHLELPTEKCNTGVSCLKCGGSLLRAQLHCTLPKQTLKKKFLSGLLNSINPPGECNSTEHTDVLMCEMRLLHPIIEASTSNANNPNQGVWVEEDGCVFKPIICPCCKFDHCIGAYVSAANRLNMDLLDMALLFCDAVLMGEREEKHSKYWETQVTEERCYTESLCSFAKRASQAQTSPRLKLKLPRRD